MAEHAGSPLVAKRFFVDFTFDVTSADSWATYTRDATLAAVPLDRTLVRRVGYLAGRSDGGGSGVYWTISDGGLWFTSPTNLRLVYVGQYHTSPLSGQIFRAEVIILNSKPKSLQNVMGNGAATQTIAPVDTNKAVIMDGMFHMNNSYADLYPNFASSSQVAWSASLTANDRYQVVEF